MDQDKLKLIIRQFVKFAIIGGINTAVDFGILNVLSWATGITSGNGLIPLNVISFSVAVINSYLLNKHWAFKDSASGEGGKKFSMFLLVSVIGVIINTVVLRVVTTNIDPMFELSPQLWLNVGKAAATVVSLIWNFLGYKFFVFKK